MRCGPWRHTEKILGKVGRWVAMIWRAKRNGRSTIFKRRAEVESGSRPGRLGIQVNSPCHFVRVCLGLDLLGGETQRKAAEELQSGPMPCCDSAEACGATHFLVTWRWRVRSFPCQEPLSVRSMGECLLRCVGGGGCEEEMRVGDRGSSAEEASYTRVQCSSLVCNSRVAPPSRILLLPLHKRCLWKLRGHLVAFQPLFSIHFGSATAQMSGWSQRPGFIVVPTVQGMWESSYGVAFSPVAPTLLQLCSSSDIALFQTRVWIPPHQNDNEGATNPSDHLWPIADKAKGWKALWIEGERKEWDTAFFFSIRLDHLMSLFSFGSHTSFLLSKVRQWTGLTFTQKNPSWHHT